MGYNPDVDSDGLIGVEDLMGTLSLFGSVFDNGDSTEIFMVDFVGVEDSTFVIPEATDICYVEWLPEFQIGEYPDCDPDFNEFQLVLPAGNSMKFMMVIVKAGWTANQADYPNGIDWTQYPDIYCYNGRVKFEGLQFRNLGPHQISDDVFEVPINAHNAENFTFLGIRHFDGTWHVLF